MNLHAVYTCIHLKLTRLRRAHWVRLLPMMLLLLILTACAVDAAPPQVVCDSLNRAIYTIRLGGSVLVLIAIVFVGGSLLGQKWLKTNTAIGATVVALFGGVILLVSAPTIASTFLTAGGSTMPDIIALCSVS